MKCTVLSSSYVHLQQGKQLIVSIKCVGVNIHCTGLNHFPHDTNIMHRIMAYIKHVYITQV